MDLSEMPQFESRHNRCSWRLTMVDRTITSVFLVGAFTCLPQMARATTEASTVEPQVESILSYSPQTETAQAAKEAPDQRESSKATEDCRGCHEDNLVPLQPHVPRRPGGELLLLPQGRGGGRASEGTAGGKRRPRAEHRSSGLEGGQRRLPYLPRELASPHMGRGNARPARREVHRLPRGAFLQIGERVS